MERSRLLFVCLGNICRSPAAEGVFLHHLQLRGLEHSFSVDSAGTGNWHAGQPADARMRAAAAGRGIHLPSRARQIVVADLDQFDHILTMDDDNLAAVQAMTRGRRSRAQVRPITQHCRLHRVREVPDPYYGGADGFQGVLDLLEDACTGLLDDLLATGTPSKPSER
ncbi:low molecular weight phosphotyrosine protein phosphatase [Synechococcus sp. J7-Johnson]|uniref:low molecular weight protein-tyrosine-phosphatase n=1 Tax=Synechococcus sp. J7-Johnson TaxID=2823737 RepID=UPI0020CDDCD3|nr:low molecular weight protein-tyrosine-phosphatase [Synechococcus sp. J7-Johnson]MCP9839020.1 low molecular weight phosphotyrosine protein phosphatase [Synechococcus sp. J7-Johnson]